ncbi:MAG TPA: cytochrome c oxidase subunit 3 [Anaerolineae bacterium]|jgi:heme/copper-type cytochrome/quinol oxidase subunit 3
MNATSTQRSNELTVQSNKRPDTGLLGAAFFIVSESMFFVGLFLAYFFLRSDSTVLTPSDQPLHPSAVLPAINTLILAVSVVAITYANRSIAANKQRELTIGLTVAAALGLIFMLVQTVEFSRFISVGFSPSSSSFGSTFFGLLVFHVLRVFAGVTFMVIVLVRTLMGQFNAQRRTAVQACALYWYFISAVWILVFLVLYTG